MSGYGSGGYGAGAYGFDGNVTIPGVTATITTQAWFGGISNGRPISLISGVGHTVSSGDVSEQLGIIGGALRDFFYVGGLASSPTVDPLETAVLAKSYPTESNSAWVRGTLTALSPAGFWTGVGTEDAYNASVAGVAQLWPRASRVIVGAYFNSTVNNEEHFIDDVQFEQASTVSAYDNPRDTKIAIIPDRINAVAKQQFTSGGTSPIVATGCTPTVTANGLSVLWNVTPSYITYPVTIPSDLNRGWVTVSVYAYNPPVGLEIKPVNTAVQFFQGFEMFDDLSTRIWCSYPIGTNGVADFIVRPTFGGYAGQALFPDNNVFPAEDLFPAGGSYNGTTTLLNKFMAEAAPTMGTYFDSTYQYTNDIVVGGSGAVSFFDNKKVKNSRLTQILNKTLPIGATFTLSYKSY